jgi:hypothetical protein
MARSADEVWELLAQLAESQAQLIESQKETDLKFKETDLKFQKTDLQFPETDRQIRELGKKIRRLGDKFGGFTEGLALPSMEPILREQFAMEIISPSVRVKKGGENLKIDVLAYTSGDINKAMIVKVKSEVREESITHLVKTLKKFRTLFPEHQNKQLYGVLAGVDIPEQMKNRSLEEGLYVARIQDDVFQMDTPSGFEAKAW